VLEALSAALLIAQAGACEVAIEHKPSAELRLRPACPAGFNATREAVRKALLMAGERGEARLHLGRLVEYPWLSSMLARQASSSRVWDPVEGTARGETDNSYVAAALRSMPEFRTLFDTWSIAAISVEKVLRKPAAELPLAQGTPLSPQALLPYDAIVWVTLKRP
jgi:hypothetical protein